MRKGSFSLVLSWERICFCVSYNPFVTSLSLPLPKVEDIIMKHPEKVSATLKDADVDTCYCPIVMSGGNFNLKPSAQSDEKPLTFGVIVASMGAVSDCCSVSLSNTSYFGVYFMFSMFLFSSSLPSFRFCILKDLPFDTNRYSVQAFLLQRMPNSLRKPHPRSKTPLRNRALPSRKGKGVPHHRRYFGGRF